jgi:hypothetical protein
LNLFVGFTRRRAVPPSLRLVLFPGRMKVAVRRHSGEHLGPPQLAPEAAALEVFEAADRVAAGGSTT